MRPCNRLSLCLLFVLTFALGDGRAFGDAPLTEPHAPQRMGWESFAAEVHLANHGLIRSHDGFSILLDAPALGERSSSTLRLFNDGEIVTRASGIALRATAQCSDIMVKVVNAGTVWTTFLGPALDIAAFSSQGDVTVRIDNQAEGTLEAKWGCALSLDVWDGRNEGGKAAGSVALRNDGQLLSASDTVCFATIYGEQLFPLVLEGDGEFLRSAADMYPFSLAFLGYFEDVAPPSEEAFTAQVEAYIRENGLSAEGRTPYEWVDAALVVKTGREGLPLSEGSVLYAWYGNSYR